VAVDQALQGQSERLAEITRDLKSCRSEFFIQEQAAHARWGCRQWLHLSLAAKVCHDMHVMIITCIDAGDISPKWAIGLAALIASALARAAV
jgi:hypothetical protein